MVYNEITIILTTHQELNVVYKKKTAKVILKRKRVILIFLHFYIHSLKLQIHSIKSLCIE